ncbi:MAG: hypothetical protein M1824_004212 [Vezdaea acicularis]|nr:MAG: hypothetical protein M1824_004212 [Vezdaea acicularis]
MSDPASSMTPLPVPLPPPDVLDILSPLHTLLSRLLPPAGNSQHSLSTAAPTELDPQHLATEASSIKIRLQKARQAVNGLPDMDRTLKDQEEEIRELEMQVQEKRETMERLKDAGQGVGV